ncbi:hypothetical protein [Tsuneonella sp. SYSU-LHT278]|uniref:hypothetical protein n=1 Tax=Tsuneonella sediminis TaxID=3416089 RepID=UPI003F78D47E
MPTRCHIARSRILRPYEARVRLATRLRAAGLASFALAAIGAAPVSRPHHDPAPPAIALAGQPRAGNELGNNRAGPHCLASLAGPHGAVGDALERSAAAQLAYAVHQVSGEPDALGRYHLSALYWSVGPAGRRWLTQAQATIDPVTCAVEITSSH